MPRNLTSSAVAIDPVAAWLSGPDPAPGDSGGAPVAPVVQLCPSGHAAPGAKFCPECGSAVLPPEPEQAPATDWLCPDRHVSPIAARFCAECGAGRDAAPVAGVGAAREMASRVGPVDLDAFRPRPWSELSPAERAARERAHLAAIQAGQRDPGVRYGPPGQPCAHDCHSTPRGPAGGWPCQECGCIVIHFVKDGLSAFGVVWMRGQEIEMGPKDPRFGEASLWMGLDDFAQMERYGDVRFRTGPWPGRRSYTEGAGAFEPLAQLSGGGEVAGPSVEELLKADVAEQQRGRRVPARTL